MPSDIRSFFGGKPAQASSQESNSKAPVNAKDIKMAKGRSRKVVHDSDEDDAPPAKKPAAKSAPAKKRDPTPEGEATTTADYFGNGKPKKSAPAKSAVSSGKNTPAATPKTTPKKSSAQPTPSTRASSRRKPSVNYNESQNTNGAKVIDDNEEDGKDDIFAADFSKGGRRGDDYEEDEDEASDVEVKPLARSKGKGRHTKAKTEDDDFDPEEDVDMKDVEPDEDFIAPAEGERIRQDKPGPKSKAVNGAGKKRKSPELEDEDDDDDDIPVKKAKSAKKQTPKQSPAKKATKGGKKEDVPESAGMQAIFDSIPLVDLPSTEGAEGEQSTLRAGIANQGAPPAQGSKEIPEGAPNCLAGLSFVFTGLLETLQRDDGANLVKRYGGKVTGAPSSKTSYVVLGSQAGPKKIETIKKNGLKTINEDGLFELIRQMPANGGDSKAGAAYEKKQQAEQEKIEKMAAEEEREAKKAAVSGGGAKVPGTNQKPPSADGPDTRLWTVKYAPTQLNQICGNKIQVEKLQTWLRKFPKNLKSGFKLAGADGSGTYRAIILSGPPGIGKTTAAHLVARLEGYDVVESNASDTRSKKLVEQGLRGVLNTTSLLGYFSGGGKEVEKSKKKLCLIMDEVDGMSAGDRGGVGALASVCKKTEVPMILVCNDRKLPKMRPFDHVAYNLPFRRPTAEQMRSRLMTIVHREHLKLPPTVVNALIEGTGADIRQVVNMLSTIKTDQQQEDAAPMDFDRSKQMSKAWEKHIVLKPWDIASKILGGGMFGSASKATLNQKSELYFNDHEFSSLMLQENYLGTSPAALGNLHGREKLLKNLELVENAANSISEGDLVDRMIHGPEQNWSLMPTHAIFSFVRPASFVAGTLAGHQQNFTQWLGKNSNQGKLMRMVKEIQGHMRLHSSGDRHEVRQQYVPALWSKLVKRLEVEGKEAIPDIIELMDSYFLTKEDFEAIQELGVGEMDQERVKLETQTKSTFTRVYNSQSHPMPFMKASNVLQPKKQSKEKPDLEEALEESSEDEVVEETKENGAEEEDMDLSKDKYVKQPKKKKGGATAGGKGKGKKAAKEDDEEDVDMEDEEDEKPKKGKGKAKAKGKK